MWGRDNDAWCSNHFSPSALLEKSEERGTGRGRKRGECSCVVFSSYSTKEVGFNVEKIPQFVSSATHKVPNRAAFQEIFCLPGLCLVYALKCLI